MDPFNSAILTDPTALFSFLAATLGGIFWLSRQPPLKRFFELMPPVIWAYFLPMIATTVGLTPAESPVYSWMSRHLLPFSLFLLMMTIDLPAILKLGRIALIMMLAGTLGIVLGGPIAYTLFSGALPEDAWMGLAALSGRPEVWASTSNRSIESSIWASTCSRSMRAADLSTNVP